MARPIARGMSGILRNAPRHHVTIIIFSRRLRYNFTFGSTGRAYVDLSRECLNDCYSILFSFRPIKISCPPWLARSRRNSVQSVLFRQRSRERNRTPSFLKQLMAAQLSRRLFDIIASWISSFIMVQKPTCSLLVR